MSAKRCTVLLTVALAVMGAPASAEEINWRASYAAARDEAASKNLPIVIEVTADFCSWCRKLELTTLSDPVVVELVNKKFVAFKLHRDQYGWLADALKITGYPTMVLASPKGKIVLLHEGYVDSTTFQRQLHQVLIAPTPPPANAQAATVLDSGIRPVSMTESP